MEETLRHFLEDIQARVREDVQALEEENALCREREAAAYRQSAEQKAETIRRQGLAQVESEASQLIAARQAEYRRSLLERRQALAREAMGKVMVRVRAYSSLPEYPERLVAITEKALYSLGDPAQAEVYLRREDMTHGEYIRLRVKKTALTVREGDFTLGGVIVDCPQRGLRADMSFDAAMADARDRFGELSGLEIG